MKKTMLSAAVIIMLSASAQDTTRATTVEATNPLTFSGYVEGYYSYDFNKPDNNTRPSFLYSHNRHNEFNVNLAFVKGSYNTDRLRANLALATGTYMNANYAAEPATLKNVYEANAGYKLSARKNIWLDIGIMPSHIGFESAVSKDDWTLTRSLVAENSPYFESGAKLTYGSDDGKLTVSALALNGWQRITRIEENSLVSFGTQVYYKPTANVALNYSTFFGTDKPNAARLYRSYHNLYGVFQFTDKIGLTAGFDIGTEDKSTTNKDNNTWYTPVGILRLTPSDRWAFAIRGEYFSDENGVIISSGTTNGFKTRGLSANVDFLPLKNAALRLELRNLTSKDKIFTDADGNRDNSNTAITFSTAISF